MGAFMTKLMENDLDYVESVVSELRSYIPQGNWAGLLTNEPFWEFIGAIRDNSQAVAELRGYVTALLEEDRKTASVLLDIISPGIKSEIRRLMVSVLKLKSVANVLRSKIFWELILERQFVSTLISLKIQGSKAALDIAADPRLPGLLSTIAPTTYGIIRQITSDFQQLEVVLSGVSGVDVHELFPPWFFVFLEAVTNEHIIAFLLDKRIIDMLFTVKSQTGIIKRLSVYRSRLDQASTDPFAQFATLLEDVSHDADFSNLTVILQQHHEVFPSLLQAGYDGLVLGSVLSSGAPNPTRPSLRLFFLCCLYHLTHKDEDHAITNMIFDAELVRQMGVAMKSCALTKRSLHEELSEQPAIQYIARYFVTKFHKIIEVLLHSVDDVCAPPEAKPTDSAVGVVDHSKKAQKPQNKQQTKQKQQRQKATKPTEVRVYPGVIPPNAKLYVPPTRNPQVKAHDPVKVDAFSCLADHVPAELRQHLNCDCIADGAVLEAIRLVCQRLKSDLVADSRKLDRSNIETFSLAIISSVLAAMLVSQSLSGCWSAFTAEDLGSLAQRALQKTRVSFYSHQLLSSQSMTLWIARSESLWKLFGQHSNNAPSSMLGSVFDRISHVDDPFGDGLMMQILSDLELSLSGLAEEGMGSVFLALLENVSPSTTEPVVQSRRGMFMHYIHANKDNPNRFEEAKGFLSCVLQPMSISLARDALTVFRVMPAPASMQGFISACHSTQINPFDLLSRIHTSGIISAIISYKAISKYLLSVALLDKANGAPVKPAASPPNLVAIDALLEYRTNLGNHLGKVVLQHLYGRGVFVSSDWRNLVRDVSQLILHQNFVACAREAAAIMDLIDTDTHTTLLSPQQPSTQTLRPLELSTLHFVEMLLADRSLSFVLTSPVTWAAIAKREVLLPPPAKTSVSTRMLSGLTPRLANRMQQFRRLQYVLSMSEVQQMLREYRRQVTPLQFAKSCSTVSVFLRSQDGLLVCNSLHLNQITTALPWDTLAREDFWEIVLSEAFIQNLEHGRMTSLLTHKPIQALVRNRMSASNVVSGLSQTIKARFKRKTPNKSHETNAVTQKSAPTEPAESTWFLSAFARVLDVLGSPNQRSNLQRSSAELKDKGVFQVKPRSTQMRKGIYNMKSEGKLGFLSSETCFHIVWVYGEGQRHFRAGHTREQQVVIGYLRIDITSKHLLGIRDDNRDRSWQ